MITGLIIEEYISLIILKLVSYVDIEMQLIIKLCIINFFSILIIYGPYFSLELTCTPSILIWFVVTFSASLILIIVCILKSFGLLVKYISLYFFGANFTLYIFNYSLYFL